MPASQDSLSELEDEEENLNIRRPRRSRQSQPVSNDSDNDDDEDDQELLISTSARDRDRKRQIVAQILSRWWYVLKPWPPPDFDYEVQLASRKLKKVAFDQWEEADDVDIEGRTKVYEITHFPGNKHVCEGRNSMPAMFRDVQGYIWQGD